MSAHDNFRARYGRWALVAGGSEGIGAEFARQLAARGLHLVLVARREEALGQLAEEIRAGSGVEVRCLALDLADPEAPAAVLQSTRELEIGLLVCNAAYSMIGPFLDQALDDHLRALAVNCRAPLMLTHALGRSMRERGRGGIVLLSSLASLQGTAYVASYSATKAFNRILAEGLWAELSEEGVDVLACVAGATRTPGYSASRPQQESRLAPPVLEPAQVVSETLGALGRQAVIIPGSKNRLVAFIMQRLLSRSRAIQTISQATRGMYGSDRGE
jgi:uncharacterized protein